MAGKQKPLTPTLPVRGVAAVTIAAVWLLASARAAAADRPSEDELFGGGASGAGGTAGTIPVAPPTSAGPPVAPPTSAAPPAAPLAAPVALDPSQARDDALLGDSTAGPGLSRDVAPEDPLKIGGQLYLRTVSQATEGQSPDEMRFSAPTLVDAYFDARPNDRVRAFVLGRLFFDPTLPTTATATAATVAGVAVPSVPLLSGIQATRGPNSALDQMWLRFDIKRKVFITAGRQHVRWGTGRFWTPTDYLHPQRRNPVAAFDARPGFTMLKAHVPWEERGWNFYGFALVEGAPRLDSSGRYPAGSDRADRLGQVGGATRAELVLGAAELGLDAVVYRGQKPRFGGDLSFGIGDFDLYVDAGLRYGSELPRRGINPVAVPFDMPFDAWVDLQYPNQRSSGVKPQVTAGGTYSMKYNDNDVFTLTGEYFYNSRGYTDPHVYPGLFLSNTFEPYYVGRHYAAIGAVLPAPWSWNYSTFSLSTLGNLSDQSFLSVFNYSLVLLTHLRFEAFGAVNYGRLESEFRLGVKEILVPGETPGAPQRSLSLPPQSFSVGLGLRVSL